MIVVGLLIFAPGAWAGQLEQIGQLTVANPFGFIGPIDAAGPVVATVDGGAVDVFVQPPAGWTNSGPSAVLQDPTSSLLLTGLVVSPSLIVTTYPGGVADVYVEPPGGWVGEIAPSARLADSRTTSSGTVALGNPTIIGDAVLLAAEAGFGAIPTRSPGAWVDVFDEPPGGWAGSVTQSARLQDSAGRDIYLDGSVGSTVIADVAGGRSTGADVFSGPIGTWSGTVVNQGTLDLRASRVSGGAPVTDPVVAYGGRIYAEPARGWRGQIRPVATLDSLKGPPAGGLTTLSGQTVLQFGCRYPIGTPDSGCRVAEWLFQPLHGRWSGVIAAQPAASEGHGNAGSFPPASVLANPSTIVNAAFDGTITIDHIEGHYGYHPKS